MSLKLSSEHEEWRKEVRNRLSSIETVQIEFRERVITEMADIKAKMVVAAQIERLEARIRTLEDERNRAAGGFKILMLLGSGAGALIGWIVAVTTRK